MALMVKSKTSNFFHLGTVNILTNTCSHQTLWYLQAYLSDCSQTPNSPSFKLCKRVFNKCQAIVFSDGSSAQIALADSGSVHPEILTNKVKENVAPALVGMAAMLAGIGQPLMTKKAGQIAIAQGRRNRALSITEPPPTALARRNTVNGDGSESPNYEEQRSQRLELSPTVISKPELNRNSSLPSSPTKSSPGAIGTSHQFMSASQPDLPIPKRHSFQFQHVTNSPSLEDLHRGKAFSVGRYLKHAQQKINRKINPAATSSGSLPGTLSVFDPSTTVLAKSTVPTISAPLSPSLSHISSSEEILYHPHTPKQVHGHSPYSMSTESVASQGSEGDGSDSSDSDEEMSTLARLSLDHRRSLLKSNYFNSEMQFLLALVDIATRLVIVPKHARVSSLHAELTLLNHNLPAEICVPLWCPATMERPHHHRVVRISPSDAVVLNSAERVSLVACNIIMRVRHEINLLHYLLRHPIYCLSKCWMMTWISMITNHWPLLRKRSSVRQSGKSTGRASELMQSSPNMLIMKVLIVESWIWQTQRLLSHLQTMSQSLVVDHLLNCPPQYTCHRL